jgi:hypothetical protein
LRPARPAFFRAARPSCSTRFDQRCTICRCTPRRAFYQRVTVVVPVMMLELSNLNLLC